MFYHCAMETKILFERVNDNHVRMTEQTTSNTNVIVSQKTIDIDRANAMRIISVLRDLFEIGKAKPLGEWFEPENKSIFFDVKENPITETV